MWSPEATRFDVSKINIAISGEDFLLFSIAHRVYIQRQYRFFM